MTMIKDHKTQYIYMLTISGSTQMQKAYFPNQ